MSSNEKVNAFLADIKSTFPDKSDTLEKIRTVFLKANPNITEEIKYGAVTFNLSGNLVGGVFLSKKHISIEFSNGAQFEDPHGFLEGSGKLRRHLKILNEGDENKVESKNINFYIKQAVL